MMMNCVATLSIRSPDSHHCSWLSDLYYTVLYFCLFFVNNCRSDELLSTVKRSVKTELFDVAYSRRERSALVIHLRHMTLYKCVVID